MEISSSNPVVINNLSFHYGDRYVLEEINLTITKGSFLALVGPNGSGKSTLIKCILGLLTPQIGSIQLFGENSRTFKQWSRIGYVSQKANSFNTGFPATVFEVVSTGIFTKVGMFRFLNKAHKEKVKEAIDAVGMSKFTYKNIGELSGGQQQRVFIARALVSEPDLLILDEPTVGIDASSVQDFYHLLENLHNKNITLIMVTHDIGAVTNLVTDVACLNKNIHFHGDTETFKKMDNQRLSSFYGHHVHAIDHTH